MKIAAQSEPWKIQLWLSVLALFLIVITWDPVQTPDWDRFEGQAISLLQGHGFKSSGIPETRLPPAYPVVIAVTYYLGGDDSVVPYVQALLLLAALNLLYRSLRPFGCGVAACAAGMQAAHPYVARMASYYLSEAVGIFLCSIVAYYLSRILRRRANLIDFFAFGLAIMALPLNSPALLFASVFLAVYVVIARFAEKAALSAFLLGTLMLFLPWQLHCIEAGGKPCWTLYSIDFDKGNFHTWYKTWAETQQDLRVLFRPAENIKSAPEKAFASEEQKEILISATISNSTDFDSVFGQAAQEAIESKPIRFYLSLPVLRSFNLWARMDQLKHVQMEYVGRLSPSDFVSDLETLGKQRAFLRYGKAVLSTLVYLFYITFLIAIIWITFLSVKQRNLLALAIVLAIWIYTFVSGHTALIESRRNLVFLPIILFLFTWLSTTVSSKDSGARH